MKNVSKNQSRLTERISYRCTKKSKKEIEKAMRKGGYSSQREFFEKAVEGLINKEKADMKNAQICFIVQEICNHINNMTEMDTGVRKKENSFEYLERKADELWNLL